MDLIHIEADGSLGNPLVLGVVVAWAVLLLVLSSASARAWFRSRDAEDPVERGRGVAAALFLGSFLLATPVGEFISLNVVYAVESSRRGYVSSVGFWGGPWMLPGWLLPPWVAAIAGWSFVRWRRSRVPRGTGQQRA